MNKKERKTYARKWYLANREKVLKRVRANYGENREKKIAYASEYAKRNPEKVSVWRNNAREDNYRKEAIKRRAQWSTPEHREATRERYQRVMGNTLAGMAHGKRWSEQEKKYLATNYQVKTIEEMALSLGRTYAAVSRKVNLIGLVKNVKRLPPD